MSTATASDLTLPEVGGRHHFLLRRLHSLTGILFGGYLIVHLLINATLIEGRREGTGLNGGTVPVSVYDLQVNKIHQLPFLVGVEWALIYLPLIYHTVYGLWITFTGQPNVGRYPYGKNYFYFFQRVSAILLVLFIAFHVLTMKGILGKPWTFDADHPTASTVAHFNANPVALWFVYPLGILCGTYHLANGFWTAGITWGLTVSRGAQRRWGRACLGLFLLTFVSGMIAWGATLSLNSATPPAEKTHAAPAGQGITNSAENDGGGHR